jgi:hypothetical protein
MASRMPGRCRNAFAVGLFLIALGDVGQWALNRRCTPGACRRNSIFWILSKSRFVRKYRRSESSCRVTPVPRGFDAPTVYLNRAKSCSGVPRKPNFGSQLHPDPLVSGIDVAPTHLSKGASWLPRSLSHFAKS